MTDKELRSVFRKQLAPLREAVAHEVDTKADTRLASYFLPVLGKANVIEATGVDVSLSARWAQGDSDDLRRLIPTVKKLLKGLRATDAERAEVSSLIYPMY